MLLQGNLSGSNGTGSDPSVFFLTGIPGLEALHPWISIPFCSTFTVALLGNFTLLYVIKTEPSLHQPMFYFLAMLAVIDLVLSTTTVPKILSIFWFNSREISFNACLVQMFFLHSFSTLESTLLLAMAFDRYVAICNPLRYATILTNSVIAKIGLAALARAVLLVVPLPFLVRRLCGSHLCAILVFYIPVVLSSTIHRFGYHVAPHVHILLANFLLLFPPMMNPIVYGVKTKQIRDRVLLLFRGKSF
ncbi:Olfactory receptor 52K1 [Chelonia mydas]|uniref:Olfactory receptor 52K1 n=1 Tax=Chelonia mydas TaxID=8469 RepID=M7AYJ3_CHEMY|nr:Olfactory receptor 52K1 [Chelonia mydas]